MRIDLHCHSDVSDGTRPPAEVVRLARAKGLDVLALTDHDSVAGWDEAAAALPEGLTFVPGKTDDRPGRCSPLQPGGPQAGRRVIAAPRAEPVGKRGGAGGEPPAA